MHCCEAELERKPVRKAWNVIDISIKGLGRMSRLPLRILNPSSFVSLESKCYPIIILP